MGNLASPKPLRLGHAQAREWLGMALDLLGALALHSVCTVFRDSNGRIKVGFASALDFRYFGFAEDSLVSAESK